MSKFDEKVTLGVVVLIGSKILLSENIAAVNHTVYLSVLKITTEEEENRVAAITRSLIGVTGHCCDASSVMHLGNVRLTSSDNDQVAELYAVLENREISETYLKSQVKQGLRRISAATAFRLAANGEIQDLVSVAALLRLNARLSQS